VSNDVALEPEFSGRVALVTGGSRGIGRAIALQLARGGADVAISYVTRSENAQETVEAIRSHGRKAIALECDVSDETAVARIIAETRSQLGPIDLLAHCGAISNTCDHDDLSFDRWKEMIDVNLHGAFRVVFAVKDEMIRRKFGRIVMLSSVAALRPRARQIHYSVSKAGVIAFTRCCAEAFAPHNIRMNGIAPGLIETEMAGVLTPEQQQTVISQTAMGRIGQPEEIAEVAAFLLSERSSFMIGQTVAACGGRVMLP
jgi:3-oxoacyl-[acyl-carrier protein] reductase